MALTLGGRTFLVPSVYAVTRVISEAGGVVSVFNIGLIVAKQMKGKPYLAGTGSTPLPADQIMPGFTNSADLEDEYGFEGDNEGATFYRHAKRQGAGKIYFLGVNPTTKLIDGVVQNATPVDAIKISSRDYGAYVNDISLTIASSIHTIIPPKNTTFLTADSGTGQTISVKNVSRFRAGDTVLLRDNVYAAPVSKVIQSIDATAKTITFTTAIAASAVVSGYARIFQEAPELQEVSAALDTVAKLQDFYAASKFLSATIFTGVTLMPVTKAKTYLQDLTGATKATSPDAQASDWQAVADNFQRWNEEFALVNKFYIRLLGLVTSDAANHAAFGVLATTMRNANKPIAIVTGCALGDYALTSSDAAYPAKRAATLNTDEIQLAGFGLDGLPAYLSLAGQLAGIRLANEVIHNQTADGVVATSVEKAYFRDDLKLEEWTKAGVIALMMTKNGIVINQGLTTYQDQSTVFNSSTKRTYLVMLRDLADFDLRAMLEILDAQVGADGVTAQILSAIVIQTSEILKSSFHYITGYRIKRVYKEGNAFKIEREVSLDTPTDFIGLTNTIVMAPGS